MPQSRTDEIDSSADDGRGPEALTLELQAEIDGGLPHENGFHQFFNPITLPGKVRLILPKVMSSYVSRHRGTGWQKCEHVFVNVCPQVPTPPQTSSSGPPLLSHSYSVNSGHSLSRTEEVK